jgi:hypothetical protein
VQEEQKEEQKEDQKEEEKEEQKEEQIEEQKEEQKEEQIPIRVARISSSELAYSDEEYNMDLAALPIEERVNAIEVLFGNLNNPKYFRPTEVHSRVGFA